MCGLSLLPEMAGSFSRTKICLASLRILGCAVFSLACIHPYMVVLAEMLTQYRPHFVGMSTQQKTKIAVWKWIR
jgi:hypothetical protein